MHFDTATRQRWMSVLAHSEPQDLLARMQSLQLAPEYELIRTPETGLVQLRPAWAVSATASLPATPPLPAQRYAWLTVPSVTAGS